MKALNNFLIRFFLLIFVFLFTLPSKYSLAATQVEINSLEKIFNDNFISEIKARGYLGYKIRLDENSITYAGGVNIENQYIVFMLGSEAAQKYTMPSLRFLSCHELGHIIGGTPYKVGKYPNQYKNMQISMEGQSDYFAGSTCLKKISPNPIEDAVEFFRNMADSLKDVVGENNSFYAPPQVGIDDNIFYEGEYPSFQCRLNTVIAGIYNQERPSCWYQKP